MEYGVAVKEGTGDTRVEIECPHQSGLLYVVPAEASWICQPEHLHAHALAGFFGELVGMDDARIRDAMQRWGLYYRSRLPNTRQGQG